LRVKLVVLVEEPSLTPIVIVVVPVWLEVGLIVTLRVPPTPPKSMLELGTRAGLEELALMLRAPTGVSGSATVKEIGLVGVFSMVLWFAIGESSGGVLPPTEGFTFTRNELIEVWLALSVTLTVMVAVPLCPGTGPTVKLMAPAPDSLNASLGISDGLEE